MEDDHESVNDFDSTSLLCEEEVGEAREQPCLSGVKEEEEETEREKGRRGEEEEEEFEGTVTEQMAGVEEEAIKEFKREEGDVDGSKSPSFLSLQDEDEEEVGMARMESDCSIALVTMCGQTAEGYLNSAPPTDQTAEINSTYAPTQTVCPTRTQPSCPLKRPHSSSPAPEAPPLLSLRTTEPNPPVKLPPKMVNLGDFQPLQVKFTQVYTTRRYTRYTTRGQGAFLQYPTLPVVGAVGEGSEALRLEDPGDQALMPPKPKKKMRTLYTTDQLEELERLFQDDHYPDSDKRKEIAVSIGVTPQRIMVWFQNRRAKWRKVEKTSGKRERRQNQEGRGHLQLSAPQARGGLHSGQTSRLTPQASQTLPHYNTILHSCPSPSGEKCQGCVCLPVAVAAGEQSLTAAGPAGVTAEHLPPVMLSPPPLRRASLPLLTSYSQSNHLAPLLLDTPDSSYTAPQPDSGGRDSQGYSLQSDNAGSSSSLFDYGEGGGSAVKLDTQHYLHTGHQGGALSYQLNPYPQQHSSLLPSSNLAQYPRLSYLPPSSSLAPTPPENNPASYLTFGTGGSAGVVTYTAGGQAYFQSQSGGQFLLQSGVHGGITAFQACPWGDVYGQPGQFPPTVYHRTQYAPSAGPGLVSAQHYIQMQRPAVGPAQGMFQPSQRGSVGPMTSFQLPPASTLRPQYMSTERADRSAPSTKTGHDSAGITGKPDYDPVPEPSQSHPSDTRTTESDTTFSCDFSPIHF